ncbi:MAG: putative glycoside hydrolase [Bacilli bacterium]
MNKKRKKRKLKIKRILLAVLLFIIILLGIFFIIKTVSSKGLTKDQNYLASSTLNVTLYTYNEESDSLTNVKELPRGMKITSYSKELIKEDIKYKLVEYEKQEYYVKEDNLTKEENKVALEKEIFVRTPCSILEDTTTAKISGQTSKGQKLEVLSFDKVDSSGIVNTYKIKQGDTEGYIYGKYIVFSEEEANKNYEAEKYDLIHSKIKNTYNGGDPLKLDYYPREKGDFEDNKMPKVVYSLYLNSGSNVLENIDAYIEYAKTTKINTFVVDIVDDQAIGYQSEVMKELTPTSYKYANNTREEYKTVIDKIKAAGFYVIGRITVFKDKYYTIDNPSSAIAYKSGGLYTSSSSNWPTAYNRDIWYYKVALAKEAVEWFGFNEINFDYVRFPDRMQSQEKSLNLKNVYNEDKTEAIQRFCQYATDELHKLGVYVSVDVFGESTNGTYTTAYGQYWPAISNVVDVISGMPYPDHFSAGYYGISKPWNNPYELMKAWGSDAYKRQEETTSPAKVRTWIQAYDVMQHVDANGISYNADAVEKEIRGLYDAGLKDGYITWNSASNLSKYKLQKEAFDIDYFEEYK